MTDAGPRDHGGGLDAAIARFGGARPDWLDLSTGINPVAYPVPSFRSGVWAELPDQAAQDALERAARRFWNIPAHAAVLAAPGASALIARLPALMPASVVQIDAPTYNEHAAAFRAHGWQISRQADAAVVVHPNNPDGRWAAPKECGSLLVIDESFCDIAPERSLTGMASRPGVLVLKSFGKFWGLAGLRLGFAIGDPTLIERLADMLGPWPVSGPALALGQAALSDMRWARSTRERLRADSVRLDALVTGAGASIVGGTPLFRLYDTGDATAWQNHLAQHRIWSRTFPYSNTWLRLGLPHPDGWPRLETACGTAGGAMPPAASGRASSR